MHTGSHHPARWSEYRTLVAQLLIGFRPSDYSRLQQVKLLCRRHLLFNYKRAQLNQIFSCPSHPSSRDLLEWDHFLDHVTRFPGYDLPSEGVQKMTPNKKRLKWDPLQMVNRNLEIGNMGPKSGFWTGDHVLRQIARGSGQNGSKNGDPQKRTGLRIPFWDPSGW